jgi:hypothetical protein
MPPLIRREKRVYGEGLERVCIQVDRPTWDVFVALMGSDFNTTASDGVRQLVARVVRDYERRQRNARAE